MSTPNVSILYSAPVDGSATAGSAGDVLIPDATSGLFVKATTANRAGRRSTGVALGAYVARGSVSIQQTGWLPASVSGLGAGAVSWVRVSATGTLERCTPAGGDDLIGKAAADGSVSLLPGLWDSNNYAGGGGGGGGGTPGGVNGDIQYRVDASTFGGITPASGLTTWMATPSGANFASLMTSAVPVSKGGTGLTAVGTALYYLRTNGAGNAMEWAALPTFPSGTIVGDSDSQTLTNKTIAGANNTLSVRVANDVTGLGTGVATFLATPSGANLASALTTALPDSKGGTGLTALGAGVATFLGTPSGANLASALTTALPATKGGTGLTSLGTGVATWLGTPSGANLASALTSALPASAGGTGLTSLGTGVATFLGTPSGANLASALTTALPDSKGGTGLTALGSGVATMLGTFSSANIRSACTDETGSGGGLVFATSPTLTTPVINGQTQGAAVAIAALAIDWSLGTVFTKTLSAGGNTFTFSNQASGMVITVRLTSNGGGSTVTWPTVKWAGGAAPTQTSTGTDVYTFVHDGTSVYGSVVKAMA